MPVACSGVGTSTTFTPGVASRTSRARSAVSSLANSACTVIMWPVNTGTRTQVPETFSSGMPRMRRDSLRSFCSSSVSPESSSTRLPAIGRELKAIGAT